MEGIDLDVDLLYKVFSRTALSPFFVLFIPLTFRSQGLAWDNPLVLQGFVWFAFTLLLTFVPFSSLVWRNRSRASLLIAPPPLNWEDQLVLVTGGASGLGALLANTLAVRNVPVVVLDLVPFRSENDNVYSYVCDVSKWSEVQAIHKKIVEEVGDPTIIINNAGVAQGKYILDLSPEDVEQTFNTNVLAHYWILKAFLPRLIEQKAGHVVTISSVLSHVGVAKMSDYCASKAAVNTIHESLRYELDKKYKSPNVRTTLVLPGHINTQLFSSVKHPDNWLFRFLAPNLSTHTVVKKIIASLDNQISETICLPFYANFVPLMPIMPSYVRDFCQWLSGADEAARDFVKVTGRRKDEM